ncbi:GNAT family N-acetyltransferase [Reticulibacter mediterranei]|uniref:GNAT family N-acetyltransferase n=1 Tax=Reticulibacter mediterranei TaxID=2778369 RepID=A0A8J3IEP7_9CHLR|nr:GNAT family N-acetyltransferase [Reticulibacter mediterranei]GHO93989.1 GNAT family N-acetyltransferase [Reticulibacter mediterranei]
MQLTFRTITEQDIPVASELLLAAYGGPTSSLPRCLPLLPNDWLFALSNDKPIGMGGATHYGPFSFIGLMGVSPTAQRRGIGRAIMEELLRRIEAHGCPTVLLDASKDGARLYPRLGFVEDDGAMLLQRDNILEIMPPQNEAINQLQASDLPELVAFDAAYFGAARGHVLASYLADDPQRAFIARDPGGSITGFLIAQEDMLGPWMATNVEVAEQLLSRAQALPFAGAPRAIIPVSNEAGMRLLHRYGFREQRTLAHMRLGPSVPGRDRRHIYGQASFAIS